MSKTRDGTRYGPRAVSARSGFSSTGTRWTLALTPALSHRMGEGDIRPSLVWAILLTVFFPALATAQNTVQWTTNYYTITGSTIAELRRSMYENRPWKNRWTVDALTEWRVDWRFTFAPGTNGCRITGFSTKTIILVTLPRWSAPTNVSMQVSNAWSNYIGALALHESGHVSIALSAAAEIQQSAKTFLPTPNCSSLQQSVNESGQRILAKYKLRDEQYDERTNHGATQGVRWPRRRR